MLDILMPEIVLQGAGIVAIVGQFVPAGMPQHVRVNGEGHFGGLTETLDKPMEANG
jgi:hypothetical protein